MQLFFLPALIDVRDGFRVDVDGVYHSTVAYPPGGSHREATRAGTDISDILARLDLQQVHYAIDLEPVLAARIIKDGKITGIRCAGLARVFLGSLAVEWVRGKQQRQT